MVKEIKWIGNVIKPPYGEKLSFYKIVPFEREGKGIYLRTTDYIWFNDYTGTIFLRVLLECDEGLETGEEAWNQMIKTLETKYGVEFRQEPYALNAYQQRIWYSIKNTAIE